MVRCVSFVFVFFYRVMLFLFASFFIAQLYTSLILFLLCVCVVLLPVFFLFSSSSCCPHVV